MLAPRNKRQTGFTIVELLIVIVVIAILAAISVVAYTGVQNRANDATVQSDIRNYANKVMEFHAINGRYPMGRSGITGGTGHGSTEGIPQFTLARGAYATDTYNFYYCESGGEFAVGAVSKSGNRYYYRSSGGLAVYTGSWGGASVNCPGMGISSGYTYSLAHNYSTSSGTGSWAAWSQ